MKRTFALSLVIMFGVVGTFAQAGLGRVARGIRSYKYPILVAAARSVQEMNTNKDYPYYAPTDSTRCSTSSAKDIVEENKVEPDYTVTVIIAIVALAIVCIGSLLVASYVSDRKLQKSSHFTYSVCKAMPEPTTRRKIVVLANGGGILIL